MATKKTATRVRSGSSRTASQRAESGRPNRLFALRTEIDALINALSRETGLTRSQTVAAGALLLFGVWHEMPADTKADLIERAKR